jgi:hypothetical protein
MMSDDIQLNRFRVDVVSPAGRVAQSYGTQDQGEAIQAYKDMREAFLQAKPGAGASIALVDQELQLSAAAISEGKGVWQDRYGKPGNQAAIEGAASPAPGIQRQTLTPEAAEELRGVPMSTRPGAAMVLAERPGHAGAEIVERDGSRVSLGDIDAYARQGGLSAKEVETLKGFDRTANPQRYADSGVEYLNSDPSTARVSRGASAVDIRQPGETEVRLNSTEQVVQYARENAMSDTDARRLLEMDDKARNGALSEDREVDEVLRKRFIKTEQGYHDRNTNAVVIEDKGTTLRTDKEDRFVIESMALAAKERGWAEVGVSGSAQFRREAWYQLKLAGVEVTGYQPDAADRQRLKEAQAVQKAEARNDARATSAAGQDVKSASELSGPRRDLANAVTRMAKDAGLSGSALAAAQKQINEMAMRVRQAPSLKVADPRMPKPSPVVVSPSTRPSRDLSR